MNEERQVELTAATPQATPSLLFALSRVTGSCLGGGGWIRSALRNTHPSPFILGLKNDLIFSDHYNVQHSDDLL
jgi:hypothetical protein